MIQRIQSVYLFLVAALMTATIFCPLMTFSTAKAPVVASPFGMDVWSGLYPTWGVLTFAALAALVPFVNIFLYKKRKLQMRLCNLTTLLLLLFYITFGVYAYFFMANVDAKILNPEFGLVLPFIAFVFNMLAYTKIKKDDKLVRSLDRIR